MSRPADPLVGERIRTARTSRGISLRALAREVAVSPSLISQIETGKCRPSVGTLYAIITALGVSIEEVFAAPTTAHAAIPTATPARLIATAVAPAAVLPAVLPAVPAAAGAADAPAPGGLGTGLGAGLGTGPVVRAAEREVLELDSGVTWERLGHVPGAHVDFLLVTYAPGGSSSNAGQLMRHAGVEHGYLMEGELTLTLGSYEHRLAAGHSVSFHSSTPHRYRNDATSPAVGVWFVSG